MQCSCSRGATTEGWCIAHMPSPRTPLAYCRGRAPHQRHHRPRHHRHCVSRPGGSRCRPPCWWRGQGRRRRPLDGGRLLPRVCPAAPSCLQTSARPPAHLGSDRSRDPPLLRPGVSTDDVDAHGIASPNMLCDPSARTVLPAACATGPSRLRQPHLHRPRPRLDVRRRPPRPPALSEVETLDSVSRHRARSTAPRPSRPAPARSALQRPAGLVPFDHAQRPQRHPAPLQHRRPAWLCSAAQHLAWLCSTLVRLA